MIRTADERDLPAILGVLAHYNFKVLDPRDGAPVDDAVGEIASAYDEVSELDLRNGLVAVHDGAVVGFCHYKRLREDVAKTTLISVDPRYARYAFGRALQHARMQGAYQQGFTRMITYCDNPKAVDWYRRYFGYRVTGTEANHHRIHFIPTSGSTIWGVHYGFYENRTVSILETDLRDYFRTRAAPDIVT